MNNFWKSFLCVLACIFLCVASFFTGYFFRDTVRIKQYDTINSLCVVKPADSTTVDYSYTGSNISFIVSGFNSSNNLNPTNFDFLGYINLQFFINQDNLGFNLFGINYTDVISYDLSNIDFTDYSPIQNLHYVDLDGNDTYIKYGFKISSDFNFNVYSVQLSYGNSFYGNSSYYTQDIYFFDNFGKFVHFSFCVLKIDQINSDFSNLTSCLFNLRTYYFANNFTDNDYYNQGYQTGFNNGVNSGKQTGYNDGYNVGYSDGKSDGYDEGVNSTTQYSFANLLTAVVEAPVNVFISLLDFNIMGYNLLSLVVGLLSLAVIVVIIKLCLGGK